MKNALECGELRNEGDIGMEQFDDKIEEIELEIKRLQEEKLSLQMLDIERQNALILHEKFCACVHTVDCAWFHEIKDDVHNWEGPAHKNWVQKAERLIHAGYRVPDVVRIKDIMGPLWDRKDKNGKEI